MRYFLLIYFFLISCFSLAEESIFIVLSVKGEAVHTINEKKSALIVGSALTKSSYVSIKKSSWVVLLHKSNREIILKNGEWNCLDVENSVMAHTDPSWHQKYFEFVKKELKKTNKVVNKEVIAAVERGKIEETLISIADSNRNRVMLEWSQASSQESNICLIRNMFSEELCRFRVNSNVAVCDFTQWKTEKIFLFSVYSVKNKNIIKEFIIEIE